MEPEHRHSWDDGRGMRDVYLNGKKLDRVMAADTKKGKVVCLMYPIRLDKYGKRVLMRTRHGEVRVVLRGD